MFKLWQILNEAFRLAAKVCVRPEASAELAKSTAASAKQHFKNRKDALWQKSKLPMVVKILK